ncbi:MAG: cyclase family protein, partial [Silvanigrellaceae bacterium]|nr:cyclase family protein [Silvanigrellaceae bacterium]
LNKQTPIYNNNPGLRVVSEKSISHKDHCNSVKLEFSNHIGTHTDAPLHFIENSLSLDKFKAEEFFFHNIRLLEYSFENGRLFNERDFKDLPIDYHAELVLIKTGFCYMRQEEKYIFDGPGFCAKSASVLLEKFPKIRGIGIDFISINRYLNKLEGRAAHIKFLGYNNLLIFEDMDLSKVNQNYIPKCVVAAPFIYEGADGSPTTIYGIFD